MASAVPIGNVDLGADDYANVPAAAHARRRAGSLTDESLRDATERALYMTRLLKREAHFADPISRKRLSILSSCVDVPLQPRAGWLIAGGAVLRAICATAPPPPPAARASISASRSLALALYLQRRRTSLCAASPLSLWG